MIIKYTEAKISTVLDSMMPVISGIARIGVIKQILFLGG